MKNCVFAVLLPALMFSALIGRAHAAPRTANDGFILLEGGTVMIGSPETERQRGADETRHAVTLSPFYVDPFEVTQEDYESVMGENPGHISGARLPVENVAWLDAVRYCNALSARRGLDPVYTIDGEAVSWDRSKNGYRLLTEAEWEYAARAGTETVFNGGDRIDGENVNFHGVYPYLIEENYAVRRDPSVRPGLDRGTTIDVDSLSPNAFGLYHTHGNVSEWVFDYYAPYADGASDPAGPSTGKYRVNRGGSYLDFAKHVRSACRSATNPIDPDPEIGFRIARNAAPLNGTISTAAPGRTPMPDDPRVLVVYFARGGNTERAARIIASQLGTEAVEIIRQTPYVAADTMEFYDVTQAEMNAGIHPPLAMKPLDMDDYDVILLGYPTWWATVPMPVFSFLESHDFSGKIIVPFNSHGTSMGESASDIAKTTGATLGPAFEFVYSGGSRLAQDIAEWLHAIGLKS